MFEKELINLLKKETKLKEIDLEIPPKPELGDYAFPCYNFKKPNEKAKELAKKIKSPLIEKTQVIGPYLNIFLNKEKLTKEIIKQILKEKSKFGSINLGKNKKVMVEFSQPNSNKPLHIGHLRNDTIGMSLSNLLNFCNYKTIKTNLINDRGIHIAQVMLAYEKWGKNKKLNKKPDHFIGDFYVLFNKKSLETDKYKKQARELLKKWESKYPKTIALWKKLRNYFLKGVKETYKKENVKFDIWLFESDFYNKAMPIIRDGLKNDIFTYNETGAVIIDLEKYNLGKKVVLRSDGTTIYFTNDLALTKYKFENYKLDQAIWVVASEQNTYFKQLFKTFELLNFKWAKNCHHLSYGLVLLPEGKMKSREGKFIDADTLIENEISLAKKEIQKRNPKISKNSLEKRAKEIALSAIKFYLIKTDLQKDILFDPEKALSFEGETGPYIQYAYARCCSILKKVNKISSKISKLEKKEEIELVKKLSFFQETIEKSATSLRPCLLANYAYELSQQFSGFYQTCPCISEENKDLKNTRLLLVKAVKQVLENSLNLLNIKAIKEM